ncbi:MAG: hypothetical protein II544_03935 [Spirochaetales bacterium]|nr:hypothetical protein [Spirochaetales bacterium]
MAKHDKTIVASTEEFYQNKIKDLEKRLAFASETIDKLQEENAKYGKLWRDSAQAAVDKLNEKDARIAKLEATIVRLAVR